MLTQRELWKRLNDAAHPDERPLPDEWRANYWSLYQVAHRLRPDRICEIGVRAGYSAFTIFAANPQCSVLGIEKDGDEGREDTHGGRRGYWRHAEEILRPFDFQLLLVDSHAIRRLPRLDLIYVDGDHTQDGCLSDLRLAAQSTDVILVDDYGAIPDVEDACLEFLHENLDFLGETLENGGNGLMLLRRSQQTEYLL